MYNLRVAADDRTTSTYSHYDAVPATKWFLIVSTTATVGTRVVPLLEGRDVVFGRNVACDIAIEHEAVSRKHARVRRTGDEVIVADFGSRNGTLVNGTAIAGPRRVTAGDVIAVGPAIAVVATSSASARGRAIATIGELEERLEAEVDRAVRYKRPLALAMLRLQGPPEHIGEYIEQLGRRLRRMDLVAEYSPDELALVLPETDRAGAEHVARRAGGDEGISVQIGIATFPADGSHAGELLGAARESLRAGRRASTQEIRVAGKKVVIADPQMKQVFELAKRVAVSPITVLVTGETGVGKEVVAEAVHRWSTRAKGPYLRLNCASLSESLVESELFGHERGAFTGAVGQKQGFFEAASGGTLFLDEIGELPAASQAKLLRVIEQRRLVRVGGTAEIPVDVRLVCATHRDLEAEVARGRFRQDLYFRLSGFVIPVPPLRDRKKEIPLLAQQFARDFDAVIASDANAQLIAYDWPGNVRELRNVIERAVVMSGGGRIEPAHLPEKIRERPPARGVPIERDQVAAALQAHGGNQTHAARQLGISRFALIRLIKKYELS